MGIDSIELVSLILFLMAFLTFIAIPFLHVVEDYFKNRINSVRTPQKAIRYMVSLQEIDKQIEEIKEKPKGVFEELVARNEAVDALNKKREKLAKAIYNYLHKTNTFGVEIQINENYIFTMQRRGGDYYNFVEIKNENPFTED